ncbi:MAG: aldo/keto reductase [Spirochaetales bacterium]|nr:aldo/keto reductase [Spirochaetales bacterium]
MQYRTMESTGDSLSALGFGCMRLAQKNGRIDEERAEKQICMAIEQGINYIDTAWPYHGGKSEPFIGNVLSKNGLRDKVKLATKLPTWLCHTREQMDDFLNKQLQLLKTDHIDYYLLHTLDGPAWQRIKELGAIDFLEQAVKDGKIINKGFSFHGARDDFRTICDENDWKFCQIQYNILDEHNQAGREGLEYAASKGLGVIIMEPLRGGILAGKLPEQVRKVYTEYDSKRTNADWALSWVWNHPEVTVLLSGMNQEEQIAENMATAEKALPNSLSTEEKDVLKHAGEAFHKQLKIGCTGCQYCLPCPAGVDIPRAFSFYNAHHMFKDKLTPWGMYLIQLSSRGDGKSALASQCIGCGKCMKHCPQGIKIPEELKKVKRRFEGPMGSVIHFLANRMMVVKKDLD